MAKRIEEGIELFNIELDGCLNGVYTNEHGKVGGEIHNEVARIKHRDESDPQRISGTYDCFYFDYRNARVDAVLKITNSGRTYSFEWRNAKNNNLLFEGHGYKMNEISSRFIIGNLSHNLHFVYVVFPK